MVPIASASAVVAVMIVLLFVGFGPAAAASCSGVQVKPGQDLDAIVNADPGSRATTFCLQAPSTGDTYTINKTLYLKPGDRLVGPTGQLVTRGPASYGIPLVKIRTSTSLEKIIELGGGGPNQIKWLDISGGKIGIGAYAGGRATLIEYVTIHDTRQAGIASPRGKIMHSNFYNNGTSRELWGHSAAAVKGISEYEIAYSYVHNNPANGLWCDAGCTDAGAAMPNGFWVHGNLVVNNGRWGVRYEHAPELRSGQRAGNSTALIEGNAIHGNGFRENGAYGGASMWDAQNATFRNNSFGPKSINGTSYAANDGKQAILFFDSGKVSRTDLWNGDAMGNSLAGESIRGCNKPDNIVDCRNNN